MCYQLQQKRRLLNELKTELEYCRKKWALARALNSESEEQCKQLRHEFTMRKVQDQNSAESGYSDEHPSDADADDEEQQAGTSKSIPKLQNYDENLLQFDRTASPTYSERRRSESPLIRDFSAMCLFSRAQSEPPRIPDSMTGEPDRDELEVLDLIPDPVHERCLAVLVEESTSRGENLVVTPPPEVHVFRNKVHLSKHRVDKKRNLPKGKAETAEDMFRRLRSLAKTESQDCSTCSSTVSLAEDDFDAENVEEIQEIPFDGETGSVVIEDNAISLAPEVEEILVQDVVSEVSQLPTETAHATVEPQPSTSSIQDDISRLTTKEQDYLQRREARLVRLEAEAQAFYDKMAKNKDKSLQLDNHLNDIHQTFLDRNRGRGKSEDEAPKDDEKEAEKDDEPEE